MMQGSCTCLRDIASSLAQFLGGDESPILPSVLLRGPLLAHRTYEELGCPRTIVNLRMEPDDVSHLADPSLVRLCHIKMANKSNVYDTQSREVRTWLANVLRLFESPVDVPILVHCKHGRDRTGVVVAVLLMILGVPRHAIMDEFLLTDGADASDLQRTFAGIKAQGGVDKYFEGMLDLEAIRMHLSWTHVKGRCRQLFNDARRASKHPDLPTCSFRLLVEACECGLKMKPDDAEMLAGLGWALVRLGRHGEARQAFTSGLRVATSGDVEEAVVKMMKKEMDTVPPDDLEGTLSSEGKSEPKRAIPEEPKL